MFLTFLTRTCCNKSQLLHKSVTCCGIIRHAVQLSTSSIMKGEKIHHKDLFDYFKFAYGRLNIESSSKTKWPPSLLEFFGSNPKVAIHKLENLNNDIDNLYGVHDNLKEVESFVSEALTEAKSDEKDDLIKIAEDEKEELLKEIESCNEIIVSKLFEIMHGDNQVSNAVLEVSAGVGGQEAMLFASELLEMYQSFCIRFGHDFEILNVEYTDIGGLKKSSANINFIDRNMYQLFKNEIGTHRVQRVPETEKAGRIHTSTASVALLPVFSNRTETLDEKDVEVQRFKRSNSSGGQHANKTESAIRLKHIKTGKIVECNATRSQHDNKDRAMQMLEAILASEKHSMQQSALTKARQQQVKNRERSDKIRTYNYHQDRVTDHRIGFTTHGIAKFLNGETTLLNLMEKLNSKTQLEELNITSKILLDEGQLFFNDKKVKSAVSK
ncbi:peptide chain release factor 1-like [Styela clava]